MITQSAEGRGRRASSSSRGRGRAEYGNRGRGQRQPVSNGGSRAQFGQLEPLGQPLQAVSNDSPPPGLPEPGRKLQGVVVALLDSYGFIRPPGGQSQIFFHGSEVQDADKPLDEQFDLRELLQLGDEVSFEIKHVAHKDKKINAININKLQSGTIVALQSASKGRYRGSIQSIPGESSWRSQDITPGRIAFTKPTISPEEANEQVALFKPADLRESSLKLRPGDKVEFSLAQQEPAAENLASDVVLVSRAASGAVDGRPQMGCVISVKEGFGFIRPATRPNERIYFRLGDVLGGSSQLVPLNAEVSFIMVPDPRGNQDRAANVQVLSDEAAGDQFNTLPGMRQGRVIKPPVAPARDKKMDGVLVYNEGQASFNCSFGAFQLSESSSVEEDNEVSFEGRVNVATGARSAISVQLCSKATQQSSKRELGQIITMKTQFGFIKCCERPGELFFHNSALQDGPEGFAVGQDVEFSVTREPKGERPNAVEVVRAPQGSAVFDAISEEQVTGRVVDRMVPPRGYNSAATSGLVAFEAEGAQQQLPFGLADLQDRSLNPGAGDKVTFCVATHIATARAAVKAGAPNTKYAGRRAVQVAPVPQEGMVISIEGSSGVVEFTQDQLYVIELRNDKERIPFDPREVQDVQDLKPSDIVQFVILTPDARTKEKHAVQLKRIKEGDGVVPEEPLRKNPNAMKFSGAGGAAEGSAKAKANQAVRIARGPDGTRGFTAALQPGGRAKLLPPPTPIPPQTSAAPCLEGTAPLHMNHLPHSDASFPGAAPGGAHQASAQGKGRGQGQGRGQKSRAGRARGQGGASSPAPNPPMQTPQILQPPPRKQAASPIPEEDPSASATAATSRKQKPSPANRGLHRQAGTSQAVLAQHDSEMPQLPLAQPPEGSVLSAADGQGSSGKAAQQTNGGKRESPGLDGAAPERTSSGRVLNPFASTFVPHTNTSMLSSSSAPGSP
ncbi:hypothetical protein ABBQ32_004270 [Trebouxia sp. C0010 RCD-2024]